MTIGIVLHTSFHSDQSVDSTSSFSAARSLFPKSLFSEEGANMTLLLFLRICFRPFVPVTNRDVYRLMSMRSRMTRLRTGIRLSIWPTLTAAGMSLPQCQKKVLSRVDVAHAVGMLVGSIGFDVFPDGNHE